MTKITITYFIYKSMKSFKDFISHNTNNISENLSKWKSNWIDDIDKMQKIGDIIPPHEILEYITSFHDRDSFDDTDFYERIMVFEYFKYEYVKLKDLDLTQFYVDERLVEEYSELYELTKTYPPLVISEDYDIIDGTHRANALYECGLKKVRCYVGYK